MKRFFSLLTLATILLTGCGDTSSDSISTGPITPTHLSVDTASGHDADVFVGETLQLVVKSETPGADLSVIWSSDNESIATVNEFGLVSPVEIGTVNIKVTSTLDQSLEALKEINVKRRPGYRVYNGKDELVQENAELYKSIIYSAQKSVSSNKYYVLDENNVEVFRYTTLTKYYCYIGEKFEKVVATEAAAKTFVKQHKNAYVIDGKGQNFTHLSQTLIPSYTSVEGELFSGSYMYAYSKTGNQMGTVGFGYVKFTIEMTKLKMKLNDNMMESGWNAYIFVPVVTTYPWSFCDIGLIHGGGSTPGYWNVVFNNNGNMHSVDDGLATIMEYNEEDGYYYGKEDLVLEAYVTEKAYCLNLTNLSTGITRHYEDPRPANLALNTSSIYVILAASYCPVMMGTKVWDPRSGITMENLRFVNPIMKKYRADADYTGQPSYDLVTGAEMTQYTLLQQPDNVTLDYGVDGDDKFMEVSIFYDSRERSHL